MAYTKIHAIKATVDKAIDYICNPEKTDEKMFVSSLPVLRKPQLMTSNILSTTAGKTVPTKPII